MTRALAISIAFFLASCGDDVVGPAVGDSSQVDDTATDAGAEWEGPVCPVLQQLPVVDGRFEVPEHTAAVLISGALGAGPRTTATLENGDGTVIVPRGWLEQASTVVCVACKNRVAIDPAQHSMLVPNAPAAEQYVVEGEWFYEQTVLDSPVPEPFTAWAKVASAIPTTGNIDLAIHVSEGTALDAESPALQAAVQDLGARFATVGITVDQVSVHALGAAFDAVLVEDFAALWAANQGPESAIPIYLVVELSDQAGLDLLGLSPTPGPYGPLARGGPVLEAGASDLARALAHELGHYLGLWHTFESFKPDIKDPLGDTPTFVSDNLMNPGSPGFDLTAMQGAVMRRHPAVRHDCD